MFRIFAVVNSCVCFTIGVMMQRNTKMQMITIYSPFDRRNCFLLKVYFRFSLFCA